MRGPGQREVAAHPGEHPRLELSDVGDHERPALVGDRRGPDLHRERQGATAVGGPATGGRARRLVRRPEPSPAHPLVRPRPAVGLEEVRALLVLQQRSDARVVERPQRGRPGVRHLQPGPAQGRQQLGPGVGVESRGVEGGLHLDDQRLETLRPRTPHRPWPEQVGEQTLVDVAAPRHPGVGHLGRGQSARRLRREQQVEPGRLGRGGDGGPLPGVLEVGAQVLGRLVGGEEGRVGRRARPEPVPVLGLLAHEQASVDRRRPSQQLVAEPQVVAALDAHARRQQRRVPPGRVVPHPSRPLGLARSDVGGQLRDRQLHRAVVVDDHRPAARQTRERNPGHGHTLSPGADVRGAVRGLGCARHNRAHAHVTPGPSVGPPLRRRAPCRPGRLQQRRRLGRQCLADAVDLRLDLRLVRRPSPPSSPVAGAKAVCSAYSDASAALAQVKNDLNGQKVSDVRASLTAAGDSFKDLQSAVKDLGSGRPRCGHPAGRGGGRSGGVPRSGDEPRAVQGRLLRDPDGGSPAHGRPEEQPGLFVVRRRRATRGTARSNRRAPSGPCRACGGPRSGSGRRRAGRRRGCAP